jgi:hypothetical protein
LIAEFSDSLLTGRGVDKPGQVGRGNACYGRTNSTFYKVERIRVVSCPSAPSEERILARNNISAMEMFEHRRAPRTLVTYGVATKNSAWQTVMTAKIRTITARVVDRSRKSSTMKRVGERKTGICLDAPLGRLRGRPWIRARPQSMVSLTAQGELSWKQASANFISPVYPQTHTGCTLGQN